MLPSSGKLGDTNYQVYLGFGLNLGKISEMIIFLVTSACFKREQYCLRQQGPTIISLHQSCQNP